MDGDGVRYTGKPTFEGPPFRIVAVKGFTRDRTPLRPPLTPPRSAPTGPQISVSDKLHQLGGYVYVTGQHFTPGGRVNIQFEGIAHYQGAYSAGFANVKADGSFNDYVWDVTCDPQTHDLVTVRAVDVTSGQSAIGTTDVFECRQ